MWREPRSRLCIALVLTPKGGTSLQGGYSHASFGSCFPVYDVETTRCSLFPDAFVAAGTWAWGGGCELSPLPLLGSERLRRSGPAHLPRAGATTTPARRSAGVFLIRPITRGRLRKQHLLGESAPRAPVQGARPPEGFVVSRSLCCFSAGGLCLQTDTCQSTRLSAVAPSSDRAGLDCDSGVRNGNVLTSEHLQEGSSPQPRASRLGADRAGSLIDFQESEFSQVGIWGPPSLCPLLERWKEAGRLGSVFGKGEPEFSPC